MSDPVEPKVKVATFVQYLVGLVGVAIIGGVTDSNIFSVLPDWALAIVAPLLPTVTGLVAAYNAKHQYREGEIDKTK